MDVLMDGIVSGESPRWRDGRLLLVSSTSRQLLRRETDGSLVQHADLAQVSLKPWNDIVVDDGGNAYVNSIGFDFPGGDYAPGIIVRVGADGMVSPVAEELAAFACALSRDAHATLFVVGQDWGGPADVGGASGQVIAFPAPAPGAGHP